MPRIIARGAAWFRTEGTDASPGTIVCTVTGATQVAGVGEVLMGTPLGTAIELIGGGMPAGSTLKAVLSGVSNRVIGLPELDTPMTYDDLSAVGGGLGSAGFIVFDDSTDMTSVAAGVARFLAVESCGQCTPCKQDGLALADHLDLLCRNEGGQASLDMARRRLATIADGARCNLATQQQVVVGSILDRFADEVQAHVDGRAQPVEPTLIAELISVRRRPGRDRRAPPDQAARLDPRRHGLRRGAGRPPRRAPPARRARVDALLAQLVVVGDRGDGAAPELEQRERPVLR